jgi:septal ring factor EnvC (AmiA/AmiB activator)
MDAPSHTPETYSNALAAAFALLASAVAGAFGWAFKSHNQLQAVRASVAHANPRLDAVEKRLAKVESSVAVVLDRTEDLPATLRDLVTCVTSLHRVSSDDPHKGV